MALLMVAVAGFLLALSATSSVPVVQANPVWQLKSNNITLKKFYSLDDPDDSQSIIYSQVPQTNLVASCFRSIPTKYRERCLVESFERYANSAFPQKSRCCTKWAQMKCLEKYVYNNIYCNMHQHVAIKRYFDQILSLKADGSPECPDYRPVEEEEQMWASRLGRVAKCAVSVEQEYYQNLRSHQQMQSSSTQ